MKKQTRPKKKLKRKIVAKTSTATRKNHRRRGSIENPSIKNGPAYAGDKPSARRVAYSSCCFSRHSYVGQSRSCSRDNYFLFSCYVVRLKHATFEHTYFAQFDGYFVSLKSQKAQLSQPTKLQQTY